MELVFGGWKSFGFNGEGGEDGSEGGFKAIGVSGLREWVGTRAMSEPAEE